MSTVDPTSFKNQTGSQSAIQHKSADMGKDQFLKLFVAQLQHQDPMNPMEDAEFMGQMASFSTLEQTTNMAKANEKIATNLALSQSVALIGRTVSWTDDAGTTHSGIVEKVSTTKEGAARLTIDGTDDVDPTKITQVA
jgi:flagellar basal-body rod modification protein FlgD